MKKARILFLDIEATNLNANFGYMLAFGYKFAGDKRASVNSITDFPLFERDPTNDRALVKAASDTIRDADMLVTWYGLRYDVPFIQSRLIYHKLPVLPPVQHVDGWRIARYKMKLGSNRLASVSSFLELEEKTPLSGPIWVRASAGHKPSIKYVVEHCRQDVEVLEQAYERIKPLATNHPSVAVMLGRDFACPNCGSEKVHKRGAALTRLGRYTKYQCQDCGAWSRDKKSQATTELR